MKSNISQNAFSHPTLSSHNPVSQLGGGVTTSNVVGSGHPKFFASVGDPALKRSFKGHKDAITGICFNPNLKQVVSSSLDGTLMIWNFKPTLRPYRFIGHKGPVYDVCVSPNGQTIASCSEDSTVRIWNNSVEGHSQVIKSHSAPVKSIGLSTDGSLILSGSDDKTLKVFQVADRKFLFSINAHANWIKSCSFSPDTRLIGSGSDDKTVKIWDVTQRSLINSFGDHENSVNSVKFHPDGTCIASGSADKSIKIWDIRSQRLLQHYDAHTESVNSIAFHPNGRFLLSSSQDSTLKIWDLRQGHILYTLYGHEGPSTSVNFSPCGDYFCSAGQDTIVMVWKSNLNEQEQELIEEFGSTANVVAQTQNNAGSNNAGGIQSNRKTKTVQQVSKVGQSSVNNISSQQQNRYQLGNKPTPIPSQIQQTSFAAAQKAGAGLSTSHNYDNTQRSRAVVIPPESDLNRYEQQHNHPSYTGTNEELAQTLDKIVSQLDIISRTLHVLEQRVSMNEEQVSNAVEYFKEMKASQRGGVDQNQQQPLHYNQNILNQQFQNTNFLRNDVEAMKMGTFNAEQQVKALREQMMLNYDMDEQQQQQQEQQEEINVRADDIEDQEEGDQNLQENVFENHTLTTNWKGSFEQYGTWYDMKLDDFYLLSTMVCGKGSDTFGAFEIKGRIENGNVVFTKQYIGQHTVLYKGVYDGQIIQGTWEIDSTSNGQFKIEKQSQQ